MVDAAELSESLDFDDAGMDENTAASKLADMFPTDDGLLSAVDDDRKQQTQDTEEVDDSQPPLEASDADTDAELSDDTDTLEAADESEGAETDDDDFIQTVEDLAEALNASPQDVYEQVKVTVKVDGKEEQIPLGELRNGYQREAAFTRRMQQVADDRREVETQRGQLNESKMVLAAAINANPWRQEEAMLHQQYNGTDWAQLEKDDPTEANSRQNAMRRQWEGIQARKQQHAGLLDNAVQELQRMHQEAVAAEAAELAKMRDVENPQDLKPFLEELSTYLGKNHKIPDKVLSELNNAELIQALDRLRELETQQTAKQAAKTGKKVRRKLKVLKPGTGPTRKTRSSSRAKASQQRAMRLQTDDAWTDALMDKLDL